MKKLIFLSSKSKVLTKQVSMGIYHDLQSLYNEINDTYFDNNIRAAIKWGSLRNNTIKFRRSLRLGSYSPDQSLIIINPALDQAFVPKLCIMKIIYHEMLHQKFPVEMGLNKRRIHTKQFLIEEAKFPHAIAIEKWFKDNLQRICKYKH